MAGQPTLTENSEQFLTDHYHSLSRRIRVENILSRLRSDGVISLEDQETVLHKYCTQFLKAGLLIDIIRTKGQRGFEKFMEAVEYEYPDVYLETTGKTARKDPTSGAGSGCRKQMASMLVLDKMGDLVSAFTEQIKEKKQTIMEREEQLEQLKQLVAQMKCDLDKQCDEQKQMQDEMEEMKTMVQELRIENNELSENLKNERSARQKLEADCKNLRQEKLNTLYETSHQSVVRSLTEYPTQRDAPGSLKTKNLERKEQTKAVYDADNKIRTMVQMENSLSGCQESNNRLQICIEELKKESDRCRSEQEKADEEKQKALKEKENMREELKELERQCKLMADLVRSLMRECDKRNTKQKPKSPAGIGLPIISNDLRLPRMFEDIVKENETKARNADGGKVSPSRKDNEAIREKTRDEAQGNASQAFGVKFFQ